MHDLGFGNYSRKKGNGLIEIEKINLTTVAVKTSKFDPENGLKTPYSTINVDLNFVQAKRDQVTEVILDLQAELVQLDALRADVVAALG